MQPIITVVHYDVKNAVEKTAARLEDCLPEEKTAGITWVSVEGNNEEITKQLAKRFDLHPLTVEDILKSDQRPKVEEFEGYIFISLKVVFPRPHSTEFVLKQLSIIFGKDFVLSFQELDTSLFATVRKRLLKTPNQRMRQHGSDYLVYRLIDVVVDEYLSVLETMGDNIETMEESIIADPKPQSARAIYRVKRKMLLLRKSIWPMREAISHLLHMEGKLISKFTQVYLRDVYDHTVQTIDTLETFRDMLSGMLDMYLSSITNRMNEIMKTLTIITTIFIPITAIASIYGMNFHYIPGLDWHAGFFASLTVMTLIAILMLIYFRMKKWL